MALNKVLIAFACAVVLPAAALAQAPAWSLAATSDCCATATDDDTALARSVLLPAPQILPVDETATALAASVLLPAATGPAMAGMSCCHHDAMPSAAMPGAGCHEKMTDQGCCKEGCEMACGQSVPPTP
jgi:hypothetical protein